ncbi:MAG: caspase family protein [Armatimonadetes bacterium]|nr:caspase family protein [Armatimonadota bacterium]
MNDYPGTIYDLDWARPDAEDLSLVLQNSSNWSGAVIIKLLDSKAAKSDIKNALITAAGRITANGTLFLSYSGHGSNIAGTGYIVPCDGIADNGVYPPNWINSNDLQSYLTAFPSGVKKYVIIDSCYSGLFIDKKSEQVNGKARFIPHPQSGLILKEDFFRTLSSIENLVCIAASTGSELAQESNELQNGVLTYYLVQALGETTLLGPADLNSDKSISSEETYTYAKDLVTDFVRNNFGADKPQHPQIQDNYSGDLEIKR